MRVSVCIGNYAATPYCFSELGINVYCMEELCACIKENSFLIDPSMINNSLVEWIDRECGLHELSRILNSLFHKKEPFLPVVMTILNYVGLYEERTILDIEGTLRQGAGLSNIERKKTQIDYLVTKKRHGAAIKGYDSLIENWNELEMRNEPLPAAEVLAAIWHNKGVALTGLMNYQRAADCFSKAFEINPAEDYYHDFLAAKRLGLSESGYIDFVADNMDGYDATLELEREMEGFIGEWEEQPEYLRLFTRKEWKDSYNDNRYEQESEQIAAILKESYRNSVSD